MKNSVPVIMSIYIITMAFLVVSSIEYLLFKTSDDETKILSSQTPQVAGIEDSKASVTVISASSQSLIQSESTKKTILDLESEIKKSIEGSSGDYSVYIKDFATSESLEINSDVLFTPASIFKVPFAMIILKDIEVGRLHWESNISFADEFRAYKSDYLYKTQAGTEINLKRLFEYMLKYSDNTAMNTIYKTYYTTEEINNRLKNELDLKSTSHAPFLTTAYDVGYAFELLYSARYITEENSHYLLDVINNNKLPVSFNDRIVAGVPPFVRVDHKIGNLPGIYQDAGIVYGTSNDYVIVVLDKNIKYSDAKMVISTISRQTWDYFYSY